MIEKEEKKPIRGILQALRELIKVLEDMERKDVTERTGSGEITSVWYTAKYGYRAKLGIAREDLSRSYRKPESMKREIQIKKEPIEVREMDNTISIHAKLPVKEQNLDVKIDNSVLKVVANIGGNRIERSISVEKFGVREASFKNGILKIELDKKMI